VDPQAFEQPSVSVSGQKKLNLVRICHLGRFSKICSVCRPMQRGHRADRTGPGVCAWETYTGGAMVILFFCPLCPHVENLRAGMQNRS
jgi:hypothetical protein